MRFNQRMVQRGIPEKPYPRFIQPMECLAVEKLPQGERWIFEVKWDGYRTEAIKDRKTIGLYSDQGNSHLEKFPVIGFALKESLVEKIVLDGEIVALDENGVPEFQELQNWRTTKLPIVYYVFDILHLDSKDLLDVPLEERRESLLGGCFRDLLEFLQDPVPCCGRARRIEDLNG